MCGQLWLFAEQEAMQKKPSDNVRLSITGYWVKRNSSVRKKTGMVAFESVVSFLVVDGLSVRITGH